MRITHVKAENFRSIRHLDLALRPFTVVVGPNGAGKSTLLELLHLFRGIDDSGHINAGFLRWGGYNAVVYYGASEPVVKLGITVADPSHSMDYDLEFYEERREGCIVRSEVLRASDVPQDIAGGLLLRREGMGGFVYGAPETPQQSVFSPVDPSITLRFGGSTKAREFSLQYGAHTALPGVRRLLPQAEGLFHVTKKTHLWQVHWFRPSEKAIRSPQPLAPAERLSADGSDLFSVLYGLRTERREAYAELQQALRLAVPEFEELDFPLAGAGHVNLTWKQSNYKKPFYANQLSDGTLRLLWLLTIIHTVPDDGLMLIDEPELSLHPQWILLLVSMLRQLSARTNVLVATQSAEFVRWLERDELLIADIDEEGTTFSWADQKVDLDKWLKDFTLSELWTMGELGGRR